MGETTTSSDKSLAWYLRSLADYDTHRGWLGGGSSVLALCGASFTPKPTVRVVGEPPGRLVDGPPELALPPGPGADLPGLPARGERPVSEARRPRRATRPGVRVVVVPGEC